MVRLSIIGACLLLGLLLSACRVNLSIEPRWASKLAGIPEQVDNANSPEPEITASPGLVTTTPQALHALDLRPLTSTLTAMTPVTVAVAVGCDPGDALTNVSQLADALVRASLTHNISATLPATLLDTSIQRTLYRAELGGGQIPADACPQTSTWLWQQMSYLSPAPSTGAALLRSFSTNQVCAIGEEYDLDTFVRRLEQRSEWPDLLYLQTNDNQQFVVFVVPADTCGSGSGCTVVRQVCQDIFADGQWRQWCESLCSN